MPPYKSEREAYIAAAVEFMKQKALTRWHPTFEAMQQAVSEVMDHLDKYREELASLMVDEFHVIDKQKIPVEYKGGLSVGP